MNYKNIPQHDSGRSAPARRGGVVNHRRRPPRLLLFSDLVKTRPSKKYVRDYNVEQCTRAPSVRRRRFRLHHGPGERVHKPTGRERTRRGPIADIPKRRCASPSGSSPERRRRAGHGSRVATAALASHAYAAETRPRRTSAGRQVSADSQPPRASWYDEKRHSPRPTTVRPTCGPPRNGHTSRRVRTRDGSKHARATSRTTTPARSTRHDFPYDRAREKTTLAPYTYKDTRSFLPRPPRQNNGDRLCTRRQLQTLRLENLHTLCT